jgi:hypothetical protein
MRRTRQRKNTVEKAALMDTKTRPEVAEVVRFRDLGRGREAGEGVRVVAVMRATAAGAGAIMAVTETQVLS